MEEGPTTVITASRRKAMMFADDGKVDHKGERTIFGQAFQ